MQKNPRKCKKNPHKNVAAFPTHSAAFSAEGGWPRGQEETVRPPFRLWRGDQLGLSSIKNARRPIRVNVH